MLSIVVGEMRPPQREACRQAVMALALEAVLRPVLKVCHPMPLFILFCRAFTHACAGKVGAGVLRHVQTQKTPFVLHVTIEHCPTKQLP